METVIETFVGELIDEAVGQRAQGVGAAHLAEAIEALFARDLGLVSQSARRRAEDQHGWNSTFEGLTDLYASLAGDIPQPGALALSA